MASIFQETKGAFKPMHDVDFEALRKPAAKVGPGALMDSVSKMDDKELGQRMKMLSNLRAMQTMVFRLSQLQDENKLTDEHASLAKVFCSLRTRDIVSRAREVMGGNGILLQYDVARFVADAEAIYSYEGTKKINSLIVGWAITGMSAFV